MSARATCVFLDRDGVINRRVMGDYITRWEDFEFLPGVVEAIAELTRASLTLVVVTNQRGVALGRMTLDDVNDIHARMLCAVEDAGGRIARVEVCPDASGPDRKPEPGMLLRSMRELGIDAQTGVIVGDSASDIVAGHRAGVRGILIGATRDEERAKLVDVPGWVEATDLPGAVRVILG